MKARASALANGNYWNRHRGDAERPHAMAEAMAFSFQPESGAES